MHKTKVGLNPYNYTCYTQYNTALRFGGFEIRFHWQLLYET